MVQGAILAARALFVPLNQRFRAKANVFVRTQGLQGGGAKGFRMVQFTLTVWSERPAIAAKILRWAIAIGWTTAGIGIDAQERRKPKIFEHKGGNL